MRVTEVDQKILKTKKGSIIKRSKFGVGKVIGGFIYLHKNYLNELPENLKLSVLNAEKYIEKFEYNTLKIALNNSGVSFFNSPNFDTSPEPMAGNYIVVNPNGESKKSYSKLIWHHKWLWVKDDYSGFDVEESFERSKSYLKMDIDFTRIGNKKFWEENYASNLKN